MNEAVTFFRHRENDPGRTYHLEVDQSRVSIYSRKPLDVRNIASRKDLRKTIENGGGGLIVESREENGCRNLRITRTSRAEFEPAEEFVLLSPGRDPRSMAIDGVYHQVPPASHAIVPVDDDALKHLGQLIEQLRWLSPDIESLVLHAIRRPSLDTRLNKVESKVFGRTADEALEEENAGWLARIKRRGLALLGIATAILLWLLFSANVLLLYNINTKVTQLALKNEEASDAESAGADGTSATETTATTETSGASATASAPTATNTASTTTAPRVAEEKPLIKEARPLLEQLYAKKETPSLHLLYTSHFNMVNKNLSAAEIEGLFHNNSFLWGLMKLEALRLGGKSNDVSFLGNVDALAVTKQVFDDIGYERLQDDAKAQQFLAAVACRLKYTPDTPFTFVKGGDCQKYRELQIQKGLPALAEYVRKVQ